MPFYILQIRVTQSANLNMVQLHFLELACFPERLLEGYLQVAAHLHIPRTKKLSFVASRIICEIVNVFD